MIARTGVFAVNILSSDQQPISDSFASKDRPTGRDAFKDVSHRMLATGCPILHGVLGFVDCAVRSAHDAGDHRILIGEVLALGADPLATPLLYQAGTYRWLRDGDTHSTSTARKDTRWLSSS